jgi:DNA polymerase III delta prime subunit
MGLSYKRGYLLQGPPGTGKTSAVMAIANESKRDMYCLDLSKLENDLELDALFRLIPTDCVVLLDDVDCMSPVTHRRTLGPVANPPPSLTLGALLNHLDGALCNHGRIFIMTANHVERLDPALIRPGRMDPPGTHGRAPAAGRVRRRAAGRHVRPVFPPSARRRSGGPAVVASVLQQTKDDPASCRATAISRWCALPARRARAPPRRRILLHPVQRRRLLGQGAGRGAVCAVLRSGDFFSSHSVPHHTTTLRWWGSPGWARG